MSSNCVLTSSSRRSNVSRLSSGRVVDPTVRDDDTRAIRALNAKIAGDARVDKVMLPVGYAGEMGSASAACIADFIILDMVAEAASGSKTPREAAERARKRAERYYKV